MDLRAKERQTGDYGTANAGDTVTVDDIRGAQLLANGCWELADEINQTATPEQVSQRNNEGVRLDEGVHMDATNREILNTDGRKLHESGPAATAEAQARVEAEVEPALNDAPISDGDEEKREKHDNDDIANAKKKKGAGTVMTENAPE